MGPKQVCSSSFMPEKTENESTGQDVSSVRTSQRLGTVKVEPCDPIIAGSIGTWTLTLTVGSYGIDEGGVIKIARRLAGDWEVPQFDRPGEGGYCTVHTDGRAVLRVRFERKGHVRPWFKCIIIDVEDGCLCPGATVRIVLGDRSGGGPGMRAQTFQESAHEIRVLVDPTNANKPLRLPSSPVLSIVSGPAEKLVAVVPSLAKVGDAVELKVRGEDQWGNPASLAATPVVEWRGDDGVEAAPDGTLRALSVSRGRALVRCASLEAFSNPVQFVTKLPKLRPYWADLHAQTGSTVGTGTEDEYFTFGRQQAFLDVIGHQGNDFQITAADWKRLNEAVARHHEAHHFVVIPGYEWSANTPCGGDRNVFFLEDNPPIYRSSHWLVPGETEDADTPAHPADQLFERIRRHRGKAFTCAHVGGRYADITRYFDSEVCPLVEVVSCWGIFEWLLHDALAHGYVVGVMANSDGHKGRPGAEGPGAGEFGISGGLTCILAPELTREAVFHALRNRQCYGTSGPRILIDFDLAGRPMGWQGKASGPLALHARIDGTAPLEKVELFRGLDLVETIWHPAFKQLNESRRLRVLWRGARHRGRGRRVTWNGLLRISDARILDATTVAFDSPADGIIRRDEHEIEFCSQTTGDMDGLEIEVDDPARAKLSLETPEGRWSVCGHDEGLNKPEGIRFEIGPLERSVCFVRYPTGQQLDCRPLILDTEIVADSQSGNTAYYLKVTQSDGHLAWTSPVYLQNPKGA